MKDDKTRDSTVLASHDVEITDINEAIEDAGFGLGTILMLSAAYSIMALDAVEINVIAIVGLLVRCEWDLTTSSMTCLQVSSVFGQLLVALLCSNVSEQYGRKPVMLAGAVAMSILGLLSGVWSHVFWQLFLLRVLIGCTIAFCTPAASVYPAEVVPMRWRGAAQAGVGCAWGVGAIVTSVIAYFTVGPLGWRGFLIFGTLSISPCIVLISLCRESPRYDLLNGNVARAEESIRHIARLNGKQLSGRLNLQPELLKSADIDDKVSPIDNSIQSLIECVKNSGKLGDLLKITGLMMTSLFVTNSFGYSLPRFLNEGYCGAMTTTSPKQSCSFSKEALFDMGLVAMCEPLSSVLVAVLMERFGRRYTNFLSTGGAFVCLTALHICVSHDFLIINTMLLRGMVNIFTCLPFVLLREHMPTRVRAFCLYLSFVLGRSAVILAMSITQFAYEANPRILILINQMAVIFSFIIQINLKVETKGVQIE